MRDNRILSTSVQVDQEQDNAIDSPYHSQLNSEAADSSHQRERYNVTVRFKRLEHVSETSLLYICFVDLMYLVAVLLSIVPTLFVLFVCLPLGALLRYLIYLCSLLRCWLTTGLGSSWQLASTLEEIWLCDTRQHQASQVLITLHSPLCVGDLREYINTKLVMATSVTGQRLYPRFTQKVKRLWCDSLWVTDELFDINNHVYEHDSLLTDLKTHVGQMANIPLSLDRPLWEMQLIKYLDEQLTESYGILFRVHPAFADGTVLVHILTQVLTDRLPVSISSRRCFSGMYVWKCIKAFFSGFISCLHQWLFRVRDRNSLSRMLDGQKKLVSWSKPISLEKICRIRQVTRTTVTDVLLAISTQILCKYLKNQHGGSIVHIHATVPMEVRSYKLATDAVPIMGSSYAFVDMLLPTNVEGIIPKLWHIKSRSDALKKSSVPLAMHTGAWMLRNIFPLCLFKRLFRGILNQSSCFVSSLNTIETRLSIASSQVTGVVCFLPSPLESRLSFSFVTYAGEIYLAITADGNIISSLDAFTEEFSSQVDVLYQMLAHRRIPGELHTHHIYQTLADQTVAMSERALNEIRAKIAAVQSELQALKSRVESEPPSEQQQHTLSVERHAVVSKVQQLKSEFSKLLQELRRKQSSVTHAVVQETASDHHSSEETSAAVSLVQHRSQVPQVIALPLGDLEYIDNTPDAVDVQHVNFPVLTSLKKGTGSDMHEIH